MTQANFKAAIADTNAAADKADRLRKICELYLRDSSIPPVKP